MNVLRMSLALQSLRLARPDTPTCSTHQAAAEALGPRGGLPIISVSLQAWQQARKNSVLQE